MRAVPSAVCGSREAGSRLSASAQTKFLYPVCPATFPMYPNFHPPCTLMYPNAPPHSPPQCATLSVLFPKSSHFFHQLRSCISNHCMLKPLLTSFFPLFDHMLTSLGYEFSNFNLFLEPPPPRNTCHTTHQFFQ